MNFESINTVKNNYLEIGEIFDKNGIKGKIINEKLTIDVKPEILQSFGNEKQSYLNKATDTA
jgi:hypothetical protein